MIFDTIKQNQPHYLCSLLLVFLLLSSLTLADLNTYVSSVSGSDKTGDGSKDKPYKTIQKAINEIQKVKITHNIIVSPGEYEENLVFHSINDKVNLIAEQQNNTNDMVFLSFNNVKDSPGVLVNASTISFFGFEMIRGNGENGVAVHCDGTSSSLYMENCRIINNTIEENERSQELQHDKTTLELSETQPSKYEGLITASNGCSLALNQTTMEDNYGSVISGIHVHNSHVKLSDVDCLLHEADADKPYASCMFAEGPKSTVSINHSSFYNNTGTTLRFEGISNVTISHSEFNSNIVSNSLIGSIVVNLNTPINIDNCIFNSNLGSTGGAIYIKDSSTMNILSSSFASNQAADNGGAVFITSSSSDLRTTKSSFLIHKSHFNDNSASNDGSAIYITSDNTQHSIWISESHINNNIGSSTISVSNAQIQLSNTHIVGNTVYSGGGIKIQGHRSQLVTKDGTIIKNNKAYNNGGGIAIITKDQEKCPTEHAYTITNTTIDHNTAADGGGIYTVCDVEINNSTIVNNTASNSGAGITVQSASLSLRKVNFYSNTERPPSGGQLQGGGISAKSSTVNIVGSDFSSNAAANGGILHSSQSTILITDGCYFKYSTADNNGGAIYLEASNATVHDGHFISNNGTKGGAVYIDGGVFSARNSNYRYNFGEKVGGAISVASNADVSLMTNKFVNNFQFDSPTSNSIYCADSDMDLDHCHFANKFPSNDTHFAGVYCSVINECKINITPKNSTYHVSSGCTGNQHNPSNKPEWWLILIACIAGAMFVVLFGIIITFAGYKIRNAIKRRHYQRA